MQRGLRGNGVWVFTLACVAATPVEATFHLMQIEQVIGGVNGDATMQAIQLRMRSSGQSLVSGARIRTWDASGSNPVMIINIAADVSNAVGGDRVLIVSSQFVQATNPPVTADFVMTNLIPESYLAAGSLTFESDGGLVYWRLSWGGAGYSGSTFGQSDNDNDPGTVPANFGPPFAGPIPSATLQALRFTGAASALSTTNSADYAVTVEAAVFTNNTRNPFTVIAPPPIAGDIDGDRDVDLADFARCVACMSGPEGEIPASCTNDEFAACDLHEDARIDPLDVAELNLLVLAP